MQYKPFWHTDKLCHPCTPNTNKKLQAHKRTCKQSVLTAHCTTFHLYIFFLLCIRIYGFKWFWSKSSVLSHQRCLISCVFFLGIWTWRGQFTSRQPLTATLADRSFLGKCPKSLSCKYSTSLSWSPPGCWTRLLFVDYNFQLQYNWLNTFVTEKQNKTTETKVREG